MRLDDGKEVEIRWPEPGGRTREPRHTKLMSFKINARKIEHKMQTYAIKWYTFKYKEGVLLNFRQLLLSNADVLYLRRSQRVVCSCSWITVRLPGECASTVVMPSTFLWIIRCSLMFLLQYWMMANYFWNGPPRPNRSHSQSKWQTNI